MVVAKGEEKRMVRTRIEIKKIDNITTRQVTFSKRRRGLFKKAHELSILCDTEIGVIVFSSTSKLHEFSSSSTTQIVQRYIRHKGKTNNEQVASSLLEHLPAEDVCVVLRKDVAERSQEVRKMKGEDLDGLSLEELSQLERQVKKAYARVHRMKDDKLQKLITGLKRKEGNLVDCNGKLKQKINNKVKGDEIHWSRTQLELASSQQAQTQNNVSFDTSLRLGLI